MRCKFFLLYAIGALTRFARITLMLGSLLYAPVLALFSLQATLAASNCAASTLLLRCCFDVTLRRSALADTATPLATPLAAVI
jgi:hypothetical protein